MKTVLNKKDKLVLSEFLHDQLKSNRIVQIKTIDREKIILVDRDKNEYSNSVKEVFRNTLNIIPFESYSTYLRNIIKSISFSTLVFIFGGAIGIILISLLFPISFMLHLAIYFLVMVAITFLLVVKKLYNLDWKWYK